MRPLPVHLGEDVEDKGLHVEVQRLVIQEELGEQTQVLTVNLQPEQRSENSSTSTASEKPTAAQMNTDTSAARRKNMDCRFI